MTNITENATKMLMHQFLPMTYFEPLPMETYIFYFADEILVEALKGLDIFNFSSVSGYTLNEESGELERGQVQNVLMGQIKNGASPKVYFPFYTDIAEKISRFGDVDCVEASGLAVLSHPSLFFHVTPLAVLQDTELTVDKVEEDSNSLKQGFTPDDIFGFTMKRDVPLKFPMCDGSIIIEVYSNEELDGMADKFNGGEI